MAVHKIVYRIIFIGLAVFCGTRLRAQITYPAMEQVEKVQVSGLTSDNQMYNLTPAQDHIFKRYTDGLGRTIQTAAVSASPNSNDIIQPVQYDNLGRQPVNYLPYEHSTTGGFYRSSSITEQAAFYSNGLSDKTVDDSKPWSQTVYESSSLQRILYVGMDGDKFQPNPSDPNQHYKSVNSRVNNSSLYSNDGKNTGIRVWNSDGTSSGVYSTGSLAVTELSDEAGNLTILYKNSNSQQVLKRQIISSQVVDGATETCLDTYYVYDDAGYLRVIIPPKALVAIRTANPSPWSISVTAAVPLIFQFNYDAMGRLIEKKVPSAGWMYIVYDPVNRPVLVQDGNLNGANKWLYFKYDFKGRVVSQGVYKNTVTTGRSAMQAYVNSLSYATYYYEEKQSGGTSPNFYTNRVFPTANQDASALQDLAYSYYDDYDFNADGSADYAYTTQGLTGEATQSTLVRGLITATFKRTISNDAGTLNVWVRSVSFYDKRGNLIQVLSNNHTNTSAADTKTVVPDFVGKAMQTKIVKTVNAVTITVLNTMQYDNAGRLSTIDQSNNGGSSVRVANYIYNELGQLVNKKLYSTDQVNYLQNVDYRYNINGRLTSINNSMLAVDNTNYTNSDANDLFGEEILYEKTDAGIGNTAYFNGNISAVKWEAQATSNNNQRSYIYSYDELNRLTNANYKDRIYQSTGAWGNAGLNDEQGIAYDLQGNIEKLKRFYGNASTAIDDLTYTYSGNQLSNITDATGNTTGYDATNATAYSYGDNNGNLTADPKRGMNIAYNILNRTDKYSFTSGTGYIRYTYDASGTLVRKESYNGSTTTTTDYIDGFVYVNLSLSYFAMPEGRIRNNSGTYVFEYFLRDHLGNVRVSFDGGTGPAAARQENSYSPLGVTLPGNTVATQPNPNLFNGGSELQYDQGKLNEFYMTPYRAYDAIIGRFLSVDPKSITAVSYSNYQFANNNSISYNDPNGDQAGVVDAINDLLRSPRGGNWNAQGGNDVFYQSDDQAFASASIDMQQNGLWGASPGYAESFNEALAQYNGGKVTATITQLVYTATWGAQASNVSAIEDEGDDFLLSGTATSTGNSFSNYSVYSSDVIHALENMGYGEDRAGFWDYTWSVLDMGAGIVEALGAEIPVVGGYLAVDGISRAILAGGKILHMASYGKKAAENAPSNLGSIVGLAIYGEGSKEQKQLQLFNDLITLFLTNGAYGTAEEIGKTFQNFEDAQIGLGIKSAATFSGDLWAGYEVNQQFNELNHK